MKNHIISFLAGFFIIFFLFSCSTQTEEENDLETDDVEEPDDQETMVYEPEEDFFDSEWGNQFKMSFKGIINSYETMAEDKQVKGLGTFEFIFEGVDFEVKGEPEAYLYRVPENYENVDLAGKDFVLLQLYSDPVDRGMNEAGNTSYFYDIVNIGIPVESLVSVKSENKNIFPMNDITWANLMSLTLTARKDGRFFYKYCYISLPARQVESNWFLDHRNNIDFSDGENLILWGNIGMSSKQTVTEENEGMLCYYRSQTAELTKEQHDAEIAKSGREFECDIPDKYTIPFSDDRAIFTFIGTISDVANSNTVLAYADYEVFIDGEKKNVADYTAYAYNDNLGTVVDYMVAQTLGNVSQIVHGRHYSFDYTRLLIPLSFLQNLPTDEKSSEIPGNQLYFQYMLIEQKDVQQGDSFIKGCIYALHALNKENGVFLCRAGAEQFMPGETLQIAGNIELSTDTEHLMDISGVATPEELCFCSNSTKGTTISCEEFDGIAVE